MVDIRSADIFCITSFQQMIFCKLFYTRGHTERGVGRGKVHLECNVYFSEEYYLSCGYTSKKKKRQLADGVLKHHQASQSRCRIMTYYKNNKHFWTHLETRASLYSLGSKMPR